MNKQALLISSLLTSLLLASCSSSDSNNKSTTDTDSQPPSAVSGLSAVADGADTIDLSWSAASDDRSAAPALIYEICQSTVAGGCDTFSVSYSTVAGELSYSAESLSPLTDYYYRVRAKDEAGNIGQPSSEAGDTTTSLGAVAAPDMSPAGDTYAGDQTVTLSSTTTGATICYSDDGTTPACSSDIQCTAGTEYSSALTVGQDETLKAVACKTGYDNSSESSETYRIIQGGLATVIDRSAMGAVVDGVINAGEYAGFFTGINSGFGSVIGFNSQLYMNSDGSIINFGLKNTGALMNDYIVIYLDVIGGGFADTTPLLDIGDFSRRAISAMDCGLTFAPGFSADYAIVITDMSAQLFNLIPTDNYTYINDLALMPVGLPQASEWEFILMRSDIQLSTGSYIKFFATYLADACPRSDEFIGVSPATVPPGYPGMGPIMLSDDDYVNFVPYEP